LKKHSVIFVIPLLLIAAIFAPVGVYGATGVVSVNGGTQVTASGTATTVSVPIQISGSDALNGFDIQVVADPTLLSTASVSLAGGVLSNPTIVLECINGVLVAGTVCSAQDGPGVAHLAAVQTGTLTTAPTTGLLFTINYNILGLTTGTPITFNTGCGAKTSIANGDCVTIANGGATAVSETDQGSSFANQIDFKMTPAFANISTPSGVAINDVINYAALGGYQDTLSVTCAASTGLTCSVAPTSVDLTASTSGSDTLTVSGSATGTVTVTATGGGFCSCGVVTHSTTINVLIAPADFSVALSQSSVTIPRGGSDSSTKVNLAGVSGFSGTVTLSASSTNAGVAATAPAATLTNDGSGYSKASSALTITVGSSVPTGSYTLTVMGGSHSASMTVVVPGQDFTIQPVPDSVSIVRGGSVAANLKLTSLGNFAATISFTFSITNQGTDSCCLTNNISPSTQPGSAVLTAGGSATVAFVASTVGGTAPAASYTATGNYTATITATGGGQTHTAVILFNVQDFALTASYCDGSTTANQNFIASSLDANVGPGIVVGQPCTSIAITTTSGIQDPLNDQALFGNPTPYVLWVQTNAYGGLVTDGFDGLPSVAALNPQVPPRGNTIPALSQVLLPRVDQRMCLLPTFWPNGTQVPYSYLITHGPLVTAGGGFYVGLDELGVAGVSGIPWGCTFDAQTFPNDVVGEAAYNAHFMSAVDKDANGHVTDTDIAQDLTEPGGVDFNECGPHEGNACPTPLTPGNPDAFQVVAMTITDPSTGASLTQAGGYTFKLCGQSGILVHCQIYGLDVINSPQISFLDFNHNLSVKHARPSVFTSTVLNNNSVNLYMQSIVSVTGDNGNSYQVVSPVVLVNAGATGTLVTGSGPVFTSADIGHTFTFTETILVGAQAAGLTATSTATTPGVLASGSFLVKH
jgi:hypothetical protein